MNFIYKIKQSLKYIILGCYYLSFRSFFSYILLYFSKKKRKIFIKGHSIYIRGKSSDIPTFNQVFLDQEYKSEYTGDIKMIIDAGANIGLSAIRFHIKYPQAIIYAIEPHKINFELMKQNTSHIKKIKSINCALRNKETTLQLENENEDYRGFRYTHRNSTKANESLINTISINGLKQKYNIEQIDILKIDIEGAEIQIFKNNTERIKNTKNIAIELHDRFGMDCACIFFGSLQGLNYHYYKNGENTFITNINHINDTE